MFKKGTDSLVRGLFLCILHGGVMEGCNAL